jgi:hypothetical protein
MRQQDDTPLIFPKWVDSLTPVVGSVLGICPVLVLGVLYYGGSPRTTDIGYRPVQPVPYSHALHAGELGLDCRYCHSTVEDAAHAALPPTETCMNCHATILPESPKLLAVRESYATGLPIPWIRVHDLPDYAYFDHSAHVRRGVGCVECHGRVDKMEVVAQVAPLSMGWCLDCHRDPRPRLRPADQITNMAWDAGDGERAALGASLATQFDIHPSEDCSTCHR